MKLQLDTTLKTIKVEGTVNLLELTETLERLLPNGVWKTFSLECGVSIVWVNPQPIYPSWPYYPWWHTPTYSYISGVGPVATTASVYTLTNDEGAQVTYNLEPGIYTVEI